MKLKKYLATTMAIAMALMMGACSGEQPSDQPSTGSPATETQQSSPASPSASAGQAADKDAVSIGILQFAQHPSLDNCREGFIEGLAANGYKVDENLTIDEQNALAETSMATQIANTFAGKKVNLICAIATPAAVAAYNEGNKNNIPVVFSAVSDPVAAGLAKDLEKPDTGASGTRDVLPVEQQLQLIRALLPEAKTIGIMYTTSEANSISTLATYKELATNYGFEIVEQGINAGSEVSLAADALLGKVDCVTNMTDNTVVDNMQIILDKAKALKIPVFGSEEEQVGNGCVGAMGIDYFQLGVTTGEMAAKVLDGEDIKSMPVQQFTESKPFLNQAVLDELGITVPDSLADATYM